jgi:hypothetical protein
MQQLWEVVTDFNIPLMMCIYIRLSKGPEDINILKNITVYIGKSLTFLELKITSD